MHQEDTAVNIVKQTPKKKKQLENLIFTKSCEQDNLTMSLDLQIKIKLKYSEILA